MVCSRRHAQRFIHIVVMGWIFVEADPVIRTLTSKRGSQDGVRDLGSRVGTRHGRVSQSVFPPRRRWRRMFEDGGKHRVIVVVVVIRMLAERGMRRVKPVLYTAQVRRSFELDAERVFMRIILLSLLLLQLSFSYQQKKDDHQGHTDQNAADNDANSER